MRVCVLTSNKPRHQWIVQQLHQSVEVCGVVIEEKTSFYDRISEQSKIFRKHFGLNAFYEELYFGSVERSPEISVIQVEYGQINEKDVVEWVRKKEPNCLILFGTGILRNIWFQEFGERIINLHLGLSPYYRGSGTNFWPLVNKEPEYVGATILVADEGVDTGKVICHVVPDIALEDSPYDIGMKVIDRASQILGRAAKWYMETGKAVEQEQIAPGKGVRRYYRRKDVTETAVLTLWRNFHSGMLRDFLRNRERALSNLELIHLPNPE